MKDINVQSKNVVDVIGKLISANVVEGKTGEGKNYLRANLIVRTENNMFGHVEVNDVPVSMFSTQFKKNGEVNEAYKNILKVRELKTAQNVGIDEASVVSLGGARLSENNYMSKSGQLVNAWQINASFINEKLDGGASCSQFHDEIYIMDIKEEMDSNSEETGRLIIRGGVVQYGGRLDVLNFIVENPAHVDYVSRAWNQGDTVLIEGAIRVTSKEAEPVEAETSVWGEEMVKVSAPRTVYELILKQGSETGYDEEFAYNSDEIAQAYNERKMRIDEIKNAGANKAAAPQPEKKANKYNWDE